MRTILVSLALLIVAPIPALMAQAGRLSPRDSIAVSVDGREISIGYGSPSVRGRTVFGGLVPWNEVWRTGANEATAFRTEADLVIGGKPVPAGSYTLYTIPAPSQWTLIVNRETGQWGTRYDPSLDLIRVPMQVEELDYPVEQFTILLSCELSEPCVELDDPDIRVERIVLSMEWEKTRAWVAMEPAGEPDD
jgi:hypothetical protein